MMPDKDKGKANRLANEKSPYLLQHAYNPVDWYPWGEEAFAAAAEQDKPIFLSIGYSTCHWCHVMEHESFEDSSVAALMNDAFINIKVDREERPDVDDIYMTVCQMLTQSGGWPLTIVMTPEKKPFFAATYLPRESRFRRIGMLDLIPKIKESWASDRQNILDSAEKITLFLTENEVSFAGDALQDTLLPTAALSFQRSYDPQYGGFGSSPKFPTAHNLMFLLRQHKRTGNEDYLVMVEHTLKQMRRGGIFDHVGFGFHRYSTDERWLLPHFEKMLYDQAILIMAYSEAYQITNDAFYRETVEEVLTYIFRDMTDPEGGFYSAEDADSEGEEGKFYVWSNEELTEILGAEDAALYQKIYNFSDEGNFVEEATGHRMGTNIPHLTRTVTGWADSLEIDAAELKQRLEGIRQTLFDVREKRIHPLKDDKILTDWNGLMIAALARAAQAFQSDTYQQKAVNATNFILDKMLDRSEWRLMHRYREGEVAINGYLDDYAFMIWGLIELYESGFDGEHLRLAERLAHSVNEHFWDDDGGGYFTTADDAEKLLIRKKEIYDGAIPSGNSVMMLNLLRLAKLTGAVAFEERAAAIGKAFSKSVERYPAGHTMLLQALDFATGPSYEVVITGRSDSPDVKDMLSMIQQRFTPNLALLFRPSDSSDAPVFSLANYIAELEPIDGEATAYVCRNFACDLPTIDEEKMLELLGLTK